MFWMIYMFFVMCVVFVFFKQKTAYDMRISDWSSDVCSSDLACRMPVSPEDRASPFYVEGVACPHCHDGRDEAQRARYRERHRQIEAALTRGEGHIGIAPGTKAESSEEI